MYNAPLNFAAAIGLFDVFLAVFFLVVSGLMPILRRKRIGETGIILYIFQGIIAPLSLLICGWIFVAQGTMLNQSLQLAYFLLNILVIYLIIKDILIVSLLVRGHRR
ncbi:MAG: hypothetical protein QNJ38_24855 [Prochloraceae cyanobacterium]|nr:hypothetical protein [Prochloraceae cyanobacterium]